MRPGKLSGKPQCIVHGGFWLCGLVYKGIDMRLKGQVDSGDSQGRMRTENVLKVKVGISLKQFYCYCCPTTHIFC